MMYVPEQELFDQLYIESDQLGYDTYDPLATTNRERKVSVRGDR